MAMRDGSCEMEKDDSGEKAVANHNKGCTCRRIVGRVVEIAILTVVIAAVWGLFSLPSVFFFTNKMGTSKPEVYTGQFCLGALLNRQQCIPGRENTTEVYVQSHLLGGLSQTQIEDFLENIQSFIKFECIEKMVPFLCSYIFAPCSDTGQPHLPSEQECVSLRDGICMLEWQQISSLQQELVVLPDCQTLPGPSTLSLCQNLQKTNQPNEIQNISNHSSGTIPTTLSSNQSNGTGPNSQSPSQPATSNITCSKDFYLDTEAGFCKPECGQWKPFPDGVVVANAVIVIMSSLVGIANATVLVVMSILKCRKMLKFPSILILYQSVTIALFLLMVLIGYMDTQMFLCPSKNAVESLSGSTTYCTIYGMSAHYLLKQAFIFWIAHISTVLWVVAFPFSAKRLESSGQFKVIHILVLVIAFVIPIGSVAAPLGTGGFQPFYYPNPCVAKSSDAEYYSFILPDCILSAVGISLLILLFWILIRKKWKKIFTALSDMCTTKKYKTSKSSKTDSSNSAIPTTALIKVSIIFICYALCTLLGYAAISGWSQLQSQFFKELTEYFICESNGVSAGKVCNRKYEAVITPLPLSFTLFIIGTLYPCVSILYVINIKKVFLYIRERTCSLTIPTSIANTADDQL